MNSVTLLIPVEEYLSTSYRPDVDYIEGRIIERAVPELPHSICQRELVTFLNLRKKELGISVYPEQRVQILPDRFRVPDITVTRGPAPKHQGILVFPPLLCIEIQSPDDTFSTTMDRVTDYQHFGVEYVWVVDPIQRKGWMWAGNQAPTPAEDGVLRAGNIVVALRDLDWE